MPRVEVGEIWRVTDALAVLIVCAWTEDVHGEDIRIVPVSLASAMPRIFTDRDVHATATMLGVPADLIAHAWLSQSMASVMLLRREGAVGAETLAAVRAAELIGLVPGAEDQHRELRGSSISGPDDSRLPLMREMVDAVNRELLTVFRRRRKGVPITRAEFTPSPKWLLLPSTESIVVSNGLFDEWTAADVMCASSPAEDSEDMDAFSRAA
jgi:hypothetical protein